VETPLGRSPGAFDSEAVVLDRGDLARRVGVAGVSADRLGQDAENAGDDQREQEFHVRILPAVPDKSNLLSCPQ